MPTLKKVLWLVLVAAVVWRCSPWPVHRPVLAWTVAKVELRPKNAQTAYTLSPAEAQQVIGWFNSAGSVKNNAHHGAPGCGSHSHLQIYLKSGKIISVASYMRVTIGTPGERLDELDADYYFKQPDLERYLREWDRRADAGGC